MLRLTGTTFRMKAWLLYKHTARDRIWKTYLENVSGKRIWKTWPQTLVFSGKPNPDDCCTVGSDNLQMVNGDTPLMPDASTLTKFDWEKFNQDFAADHFVRWLLSSGRLYNTLVNNRAKTWNPS